MIMNKTIHKTDSTQTDHIEALQRFLQSENPLMLIIGEQGSGKTDLLSNIVSRTQISRHVIRFQGNADTHPEDLTKLLTKHWAANITDDDAPLESRLYDILLSLTEHGAHCVLVVDDAHLLSFSTLAALSYLAISQDHMKVHLHLLLSGRPELPDKIQRLQTKTVEQITLVAVPHEKPLIDNGHKTVVQKLLFIIKQLISENLNDNPEIKTANTQASEALWQKNSVKSVFVLALLSMGAFFWWLTTFPSKTPKIIADNQTKGFTLQLMSSPNQQALIAYIHQYHLEKQAHVNHAQNKHSDRYVLTYGHYPSTSAAKLAIERLTKRITIAHQ